MTLRERPAADFLARFAELLEVVPDAMIVVDRDGSITLANSEAERMLGYSRAELVGQSVDVLVPAALRDTHVAHRGHFVGEPQRRPMGSGLKLAARRKDGTEIPVEISLSPVSSDDGMLVTAAVRDVSRRVQTERALEATNQELEAFTYSVSHDLRAPIRQIDGFTRLLAEALGDTVDDRAKHYLSRILEGATHMGRLVDDLLVLARIGRSSVSPAPTALDSIVRETIAELQPDTGGREIEWRVDPLPTVACDRGLIKIVFTNLLSNAVKYTRGRRPAVVEVQATTQHGRPVISVRDNGVGFDMKYAGQLFGAFQRLHRHDEFEGTGVGLATVQRIVHKHGGDIWANAAVDQGATFSFTLAAPRDLAESIAP